MNVKYDVKENIGPFPFISAAEMTHAQTTESTVDLRRLVKEEKEDIGIGMCSNIFGVGVRMDKVDT